MLMHAFILLIGNFDQIIIGSDLKFLDFLFLFNLNFDLNVHYVVHHYFCFHVLTNLVVLLESCVPLDLPDEESLDVGDGAIH
jgi:hypothetical protein